jgi:hypothetical protein
MPATAPKRPIALSHASIISGATARGGQWVTAANEMNHILATATALIPTHAPDIAVAAAGTGIMRFVVWPRYQATHRIWTFFIDTPADSADLTITFDSGVTATMRATTLEDCRVFIEPLTGGDRVDVEKQIDVTVANDAASLATATIRLCSCHEITRSELEVEPSDDHGVVVETLASGMPIFDGSAEGFSVTSIGDGIETAWSSSRRAGFFAAHPFYSRVGVSGSPFSRPFKVLGRKRHRTSTVATMQVRAYVRAGAGSTGAATFTMTSGDSITLTSGVAAAGSWLSGEVDIDCDDFTDAYGRRSTRFDKCTVTFVRASGANTVNLDHVCAGESP